MQLNRIGRADDVQASGPVIGDDLTKLAGELGGAVRAVQFVRQEAGQDALDVLAVAAGVKPLAVVGCGYEAPDFVADVAAAARAAGLWAEVLPGWGSAAVPDIAWYRAAHRELPVLLVSVPERRAEMAALAGQRLDAAAQAAALGYPLCCVREFNRQQRLLHLITLRMIARQAGNDDAQMRRLVEAQVVLTPRTPTEARRLACATRAVFAPFTSIAMCRACAADSQSPARQIAARFGALAASTGFDTLLH